jgi:uncharacterized cysteine cluster protein YcgN (CxxCxxCC family)
VLYEGKKLPEWHPLKQKGKITHTIKDLANRNLLLESDVPDSKLEQYILDDKELT